jgi:hypothetical protein
MKEEKFEILVPEFFCALGKLYEKKPAFFWSHLRFVVEHLLYIFGYLHQLKEYEDFKYDLDSLVSPLIEEFIEIAEHPSALEELMVLLHMVRGYLKQELEFRKSDAYQLS